ncbi:MAG: prolipoprotein diacylglyceryl transferase, partial [Candidatus Omnitrophota bacterium]|nr:prolipoprotein diacylglyceryl transferase [Candidatus Omnitrophota bacterium]
MHPIIAKIGPFTIYSYGMMVAIAFLLGIFVAKQEAVRKNIRPDLVYDLGFYLLIGSIIGARIYYVIFFDLKGFLEDSVSIFKVWQGGLAIHGGIFGGIIAGIIFAKIRKISFWALA